jgi:hypothetical protein
MRSRRRVGLVRGVPGRVTFGWEAPFVVAGDEVAIDGFPRFDNPFVRAEFGARLLEVEHEGFGLRLDFDAPSREAVGP